MPQKLDTSVFARDPNGQLTEENLQKILAAPLELELPARVGILPIMTAKDWRGPSPSFKVPGAIGRLVKKLRGTEPFTVVSELMPIPSGALGMEALREVAARYRLRYVLLYREQIGTRTKANGWSAGYVTLLGALFLPGDTLTVGGFVEATMFDVKNGTLLFTVRRRVHGKRTSNVWHTSDKLAKMRNKAAVSAAPALAKDIRHELNRYAAAVRQENARKSQLAHERLQEEIDSTDRIEVASPRDDLSPPPRP